MARRRKQTAPVDGTPPGWLFRFDFLEWDCPEIAHLSGMARWKAAYQRRREAAKAWLREHDMVMWPYTPLTQAESVRIRREEPWRMVQRPR